MPPSLSVLHHELSHAQRLNPFSALSMAKSQKMTMTNKYMLSVAFSRKYHQESRLWS